MSEIFLVCGLGSLGKNCVIALKKFGVKVIAIEKNSLSLTEINQLEGLIDDLIIGDCSDKNILRQCQINSCRAALIVTTSEKVNIQTAIAIRQLNPNTRLVVRSPQENLNNLLSQQLGSFCAYEPTQIPANAFALSALDTQIIGLLYILGQKVRISQKTLEYNDAWCYNYQVSGLNTRHRRIISHRRHHALMAGRNEEKEMFFQWENSLEVLPKDTIIYVETEENFKLNNHQSAPLPSRQSKLNLSKLKDNIIKYISNFLSLNFKQQIKRVAFFSAFIVIILVIIGTVLFKIYYPETSIFSAFSVTAILLLGGYADLFGEFIPRQEVPEWLQLFALTLTVAGTAFVGVLYALLTEALLSSKFQLAKKRPSPPQENHIVIVGFGRVGQKVAQVLQDFKESVLVLTANTSNEIENFDLPIIYGELPASLKSAPLAHAKSVVICTDDDILNLELALMVKNINPQTRLVIRTNGDGLTENLSQLLPTANVIGAYEVAAEAFTGAAFGENILNICRVEDETILVTEYNIEGNDTLHHLLLAQIAYGYSVVPIFYQNGATKDVIYLPSDDLRLSVGDKLIVLATIDSLKRIEKGELISPHCNLTIHHASDDTATFEGANAISRISGCNLDVARRALENLPQKLPFLLYPHQAMRLQQTLKKNRVEAEINN
ncbi:MAG: NAD-binding protein [Cyanobacterium sp. T60_A2020_053]|nr:NAD-binding protein [Cyanobacterium sp. T60_A2020_053]